ncbi:TPA: phage minor capsid protein [Streptococcus suis]|nr:phage minor capsid protein [Streptococcus suis]
MENDSRLNPTFNEQHFSRQMHKVSNIYYLMQMELFESMIRRLKRRGTANLQENPYVWQLEKLNDMHMLNEENLKIIIEHSGIAEDVLRDVITNEGLKVYKDTKDQLEEDLGMGKSGQVRNGVVETLEAYVDQAQSHLNLINSNLPESVREVYQSVVERTVAQVVSGTKTAEVALNETILEWHKRGFTGFTDSLGREWRSDVYARTVIKSTTYKVYNHMRVEPADELGIDTFYYSMKSAARPACSPLQGQIVTKGEAREEHGIYIFSLRDFGYGTAAGCLGIHCGHYLSPFIVGINQLPEVPDYLKNLSPQQAEANAKVEAKQRSLERAIRHHKERMHYAKKLGAEDVVTTERLQVRMYQNKIKNLVEEHSFLHRDYSRERNYYAA